jgi:hypothetical protein
MGRFGVQPWAGSFWRAKLVVEASAFARHIVVSLMTINNPSVPWIRTNRKFAFQLVAVCSLLVLVALGILLIVIFHRRLATGSEADASLKTLEKDFTLITPLPGAARLRYESSHKGSLGSVSADYRTAQSYLQIRTHYDDELKKTDWIFVGEKPVKIWWHDYGGKEAFYCKGRYTATLEYAGQSEAEFGWTYNLNLSWGLGECLGPVS